MANHRVRLIPRNPNPKKQLSQEKKAFALGMLAMGKTHEQVAGKMHVATKTIQRLVKRARNLPEFETFRVVRSCGSQMVRRSPGSNRYARKFTIATVKHAASTMAWGGFSAAGLGGLHFLPKGVTMNSDRYIEVLRQFCFPVMAANNDTILLQDSAPCHVSKKTKAFIAEEGPAGIQLIKWPGNSPDCNPIENLWHIIKCRLQEMDTGSVPKLIAAIKLVWQEGISAEVVNNLVESMPRRMAMVVEAGGEMTKY